MVAQSYTYELTEFLFAEGRILWP